MESWVYILLAVLTVIAIVGGVGYYLYRQQRLPPVILKVPVLRDVISPYYVSGGGQSFLITLGIGASPYSEIPAFILFGLAANPGGVIPPTIELQRRTTLPWSPFM